MKLLLLVTGALAFAPARPPRVGPVALRAAEDDRAAALDRWGWNERWDAVWRAVPDLPDDAVPARVVVGGRRRWQVEPAVGDAAGASSATGATGADLSTVLVGDWVAVTPTARGDAEIVAVLPRAGVLQRERVNRKKLTALRDTRWDKAKSASTLQPLCANVDVVLVVTSASLEFNAARLARYLTVASTGGAESIVVLNKIDLAGGDGDAWRDIAAAACADTRVVATSAEGAAGPGLRELEGVLETGKTYAMLGSSGVGKSSLMNRLLGNDAAATSAVREVDDRGRHTTTRRALRLVPTSGAMLMDTPGLRSIGMHAEVDLALRSDSAVAPTPALRAFADVARYAGQCRFKDCDHSERASGCALQAAVDDGELEPERLESYLDLHSEALLAPLRADTDAGPKRGTGKAPITALSKRKKKKGAKGRNRQEANMDARELSGSVDFD